MNERIEYVSDRKVLLYRNDRTDDSLEVHLGGGMHMQLYGIYSNAIDFDEEGLDALEQVIKCARTGSFATLQPTPKVRPYTPAEAAAHLGRCFNTGPNTLPLNTIREHYLGHETNAGGGIEVTYKSFAKCTWDDGTPCGVVE